MSRMMPALILILLSAPAWAIYKCEADGKISYSEAPCGNGNSLPIKVQVDQSPPEAELKNARQQSAQQKKELDRLEKERHKREAEQAQADRRAAQQCEKRAGAGYQRKCEALGMRKEWAEQGARSPSLKEPEKARVNAQRLAERYERECGK